MPCTHTSTPGIAVEPLEPHTLSHTLLHTSTSGIAVEPLEPPSTYSACWHGVFLGTSAAVMPSSPCACTVGVLQVCCGVLQYVAVCVAVCFWWVPLSDLRVLALALWVCCSVLQCIKVWCSVCRSVFLTGAAVRPSSSCACSVGVLQCVAVCCSVLQCGAVWCSVFLTGANVVPSTSCCSVGVLQRVAVWFNVCCSVLQAYTLYRLPPIILSILLTG